MSDYQKMGLRKNPFQQLLPETTLQRPVHFGVSPILRGRNGGGSAPKCEKNRNSAFQMNFPIKNGDFPIKNGDFPFFFGFFSSENPLCPIHWTGRLRFPAIGEPSRRLRLMQHLDSLEVGVSSRSKGSEIIGSVVFKWQCVKTLYPFCSHQNSW